MPLTDHLLGYISGESLLSPLVSAVHSFDASTWTMQLQQMHGASASAESRGHVQHPATHMLGAASMHLAQSATQVTTHPMAIAAPVCTAPCMARGGDIFACTWNVYRGQHGGGSSTQPHLYKLCLSGATTVHDSGYGAQYAPLSDKAQHRLHPFLCPTSAPGGTGVVMGLSLLCVLVCRMT